MKHILLLFGLLQVEQARTQTRFFEDDWRRFLRDKSLAVSVKALKGTDCSQRKSPSEHIFARFTDRLLSCSPLLQLIHVPLNTVLITSILCGVLALKMNSFPFSQQ